MRRCLGTEPLTKLRCFAPRDVKLLFDLRSLLIEVGQGTLVGLLRHPHFSLSRLQNSVDRPDEEVAHDEIVHDEDRQDGEQREIRKQVDLHTFCEPGNAAARRL